ncbi:MAG: rod shape-determining protein MreC [Bacteroidaceae bacterium]|nr:rod shape-determining protein MreC [Bacteroidaceae bacterium]
MRALFDFFVKHGSAFLFIVLEGVSLLLLFTLSESRNAAIMTSAGNISGSILKIRSSIGQYFSLKDENTALAIENSLLRERLWQYESDSAFMAREQMETLLSNPEQTVLARVIDNSTRHDDNFVTIDRGTIDGVEEGMGVYDSHGAVGVVMIAGSRYSIVLPILNSRTSLSCKIRNTDQLGFVEWKGGSVYEALLIDIPYQSNVQIGDTVQTSGFSWAFPEGLMVGTVAWVKHRQNANTLDIGVTLASELNNLGWVFVHQGTPNEEIEAISELILQQNN